MCNINSAAATTTATELTGANLPLALNIAGWTDLHTKFVAFVRDIYPSYPTVPTFAHQLTKDIYDCWISQLLIYPVAGSNNPALKRRTVNSLPVAVNSTSDFFKLLNETEVALRGQPGYENYLLFQYVGLYHFVIWCFLDKSTVIAAGSVLWPSGVPLHLLPYELYLFVKKAIRDKTYTLFPKSQKLRAVVRVGSNFLHETRNSGGVQELITSAVWPTLDIDSPDNAFIKGFVAEFDLLSTAATNLKVNFVPYINHGLQNVANGRNHVYVEPPHQGLAPEDKIPVAFHFVSDVRDAIQTAADNELRQILSSISVFVIDKFGDFKLYGTGDGTSTRSLFGYSSYALPFVRYSLKGNGTVTNTDNLTYLGIQDPVTDIAVSNGSFLAYLGLDKPWNGSMSLLPNWSSRVDVRSSSKTTTPVLLQLNALRSDSCYFQQQASGAGLSYTSVGSARGRVFVRPATASKFSGAFRTDPVDINLIPDPSGQREELVLVAFNCAIPPPPPQGRAAATLAFGANNFMITMTQRSTMWAGSQAGDLDDVIVGLLTRLASDPSAAITIHSSLSARSIGKLRRVNGQFEVVTDDNQKEVGQAGSQETTFQQLRITRGTVTLGDGDDIVLDFTSDGYVSPDRCGWIDPASTWQKFTPAQRILLENLIGKYVVGYGTPEGPKYNWTLSGFRAYAMFETMVRRMIQRMNELILTQQLSAANAAQVPAATSALMNYLCLPSSDPTRPSLVIPQPPVNNSGASDKIVTKPDGTPVYVDYDLIHLFDYAP